MSKKITVFFLLILLVIGLCSCTVTPADLNSENGKSPDSIHLSSKFTNGMADFSIGLLKQTLKEQSVDDNVVLSPVSVAAALTAAETGASGDTLAEMEDILGNGLQADDYRKNLFRYLDTCMKSEDSPFSSAQSIWINGDDMNSIQEDFLRINTEQIKTDLTVQPFDANTANVINVWAEKNTNGKITKIVDQIPSGAVMYLVNATQFNGIWEKPYEDYQISDGKEFTSASGKKRTVTMLYETQPYYIEVGNAIGFIKPYKGNSFNFVAILPPEDISVADYLNTLSAKDIVNARDNLREDKIAQTVMPKIEINCDFSLTNTIQQMGINKAFNETAEFDRIFKNNRSLFISEIIHKTYFSLDRNGTEASAATSIEVMESSSESEEKEVLEIKLNRPYLFWISDISSGLPIFMGIVNDIP